MSPRYRGVIPQCSVPSKSSNPIIIGNQTQLCEKNDAPNIQRRLASFRCMLVVQVKIERLSTKNIKQVEEVATFNQDHRYKSP
jgi:hypothetical protein